MVYLVYRIVYETPLTRQIQTFDDKTLFDFFQRIWAPVENDGQDPAKYKAIVDAYYEWIGGDEYVRIYNLVDDMFETGACPDTPAALTKWLDGHRYGEGTIRAQEHAIQSADDDDEYDQALLLFDDEFRKSHPDRVDFLLREEWELPESVLTTAELSELKPFHWAGETNELYPDGKDEGTTFACLFVIDDGAWLMDLLGPYQFDKVRMPQFLNFLAKVPDEVIEESEAIEAWFAPDKWRPELIELRRLAMSGNSETFAQLLTAYNEIAQQTFEAKQQQSSSSWTKQWLQPRIQASPHMTQIAFTTRSTFRETRSHESTVHWCFFDDLWASSHPDLAKSILWAAKKDTCLF